MREHPFEEPLQAIQIGRTTKEEVQHLLGEPYDKDAAGAWEVYLEGADGIVLVAVFPIPEKDAYSQVLLVVYNEADKVVAVDMETTWGGFDSWDENVVCGASICYRPSTGHAFNRASYARAGAGEAIDSK